MDAAPVPRFGFLAINAVVSLAMLCGPSARPATAGSPWGLPAAGGPRAVWDPSRFADYLYSGQAPHPAVARIVAPESAGTSLGSGVLVDVNDAQGLVITNWHVVRDSTAALLVQFADGFQSAGSVVHGDEVWDLAAVVIWKPSAAPVPIADRPSLVGEPLTIAGFGRGAYREESGVCRGYLSPGSGHPPELVELEATARQGDSGGAIFTARRELAGVLFGQADGRTIGSCSARVRMFLSAVGSAGFRPPAFDGSTSVVHDAPHREVVPPVPRWDAPDPGSKPATLAPTPGGGGPAGGGLLSTAAPPLPSLAVALMRATSAERAHLVGGAGGLALALVGLRIVFRGRRFGSWQDG